MGPDGEVEERYDQARRSSNGSEGGRLRQWRGGGPGEQRGGHSRAIREAAGGGSPGSQDSNSKRKSRNAREKRDGSSGTNVDAEKFAKELGVLKPWEKVGE
jgi:hypothetical protein